MQQVDLCKVYFKNRPMINSGQLDVQVHLMQHYISRLSRRISEVKSISLLVSAATSPVRKSFSPIKCHFPTAESFRLGRYETAFLLG